MELKENSHSHKPIILKDQFLISVAKKASFQAMTAERSLQALDQGIMMACSVMKEAVNLCGSQNPNPWPHQLPRLPSNATKSLPLGPVGRQVGTPSTDCLAPWPHEGWPQPREGLAWY